MDLARAMVSALRDWKADNGGLVRKRFEQAKAINATCTWDVRAAEWQQLAARWLANR
jgi:hypothetical protein